MSDVRDGKGRYADSPATAERDAKAADLRSRHFTYQHIADKLGFAHRDGAREAVVRAMQRVVREAADEVRVQELERLDRYARKAEEVLDRAHYAHSAGRLITMKDEAGESRPVLDDGPVMAALDRLVKIQDRRARLLGLDAPTRVEATVRSETDAAIAELAEQLGLQPGPVPAE